MGEILIWLINSISYLVSQALNWKILGYFSLLHFIIGAMIISIIYKFITFGLEKEDR